MFYQTVLFAAAAGMSGILLFASSAFSQTDANASLNEHVTVQDDSIRAFHVHFPDEALTDLRQRIAATRWPDRETVTDASQGVQLATMQKLAQYWATDYDWRKCEAKLNALPQFVTNNRWGGNSFHPCPLEKSQCLADHYHARLARIDH